MNKKQGDQIEFSPEKKALLEEDSSVLQEMFSYLSKCLSCNGENRIERS